MVLRIYNQQSQISPSRCHISTNRTPFCITETHTNCGPMLFASRGSGQSLSNSLSNSLGRRLGRCRWRRTTGTECCPSSRSDPACLARWHTPHIQNHHTMLLTARILPDCMIGPPFTPRINIRCTCVHALCEASRLALARIQDYHTRRLTECMRAGRQGDVLGMLLDCRQGSLAVYQVPLRKSTLTYFVPLKHDRHRPGCYAPQLARYSVPMSHGTR